jgi:methionyl-tRNA formyltransferase|tara:strand:- start:50 stop:871 length:822 start_codon:yes stop_codon:yes gene_type:complete
MKNIIFFSGNQLRHKFIADKLISKNYNLIWITMPRERDITYKGKTSNSLKNLLNIHNKKRINAENKYFSNAGKIAKKKCKKIINLNKKLDDDKIIKKNFFQFKPKLFITYGCRKVDIIGIKKNLKHHCYFWNLHAGLSPWYRGSITHFWPSYMLEPEFTGVTLHEITSDIDWGPVIDQTRPKLHKTDGVHDTSCKSILRFGNSLRNKIKKIFNSKHKIKGIPHKSQGRIWTNKMWSPKHLKLIYETYNDRINKYCLNNKTIKKVKIKSVFNKL